jgi:hypothetical protein
VTKLEVPTVADVRAEAEKLVSKVERPHVSISEMRDRAAKVELPKVELPTVADVRDRVAKVELPKVELPTVASLRADATELAADAQEQATALYRKVLATIK